MKNLAVLIIDLDKLSKEEWSNLWLGSGVSVHKIEEGSTDRITEFLDQVQQDELDAKNTKII